MSSFKLVIFVCCRDIKGKSLEQYVAETSPKVPQNDQPALNLKQWYKERKDILFILDGLDECNNDEDSRIINRLLQGGVYTGMKTQFKQKVFFVRLERIIKRLKLRHSFK